MRIIKTYVNGRFYDTNDKRYIGKDQVAALLEDKKDIQIIMHQTGSDVTQSVSKRLAPSAGTKKASVRHIDSLKQWLSDQVDRRIETAVALINLPTRDQVRRLSADIEKLTKRVDGLQARLVKAKPPVKPPESEPAKTVGHQA
jgi:hypothetical protein